MLNSLFQRFQCACFEINFLDSNVMQMWSLRWQFTNRSVTGAPYNIKVTVCHTAGHYGEEYDDWNRSWRNCSSDGAEWTDGGRAFHARKAATGKARSPSMVHHVDGTTSVDAKAHWRRRHEPTSAVRWRVSVRYDGAMLLRQQYVRMHNHKVRGFDSVLYNLWPLLPLKLMVGYKWAYSITTLYLPSKFVSQIVATIVTSSLPKHIPVMYSKHTHTHTHTHPDVMTDWSSKA